MNRDAARRYLTEREAADHLSVSAGLLRKLRKLGQPPHPVRIGGKSVRYPIEALDALGRVPGEKEGGP